ncbi:hypothetical protein ACJX0J_038942, partial [Zea mays]
FYNQNTFKIQGYSGICLIPFLIAQLWVNRVKLSVNAINTIFWSTSRNLWIQFIHLQTIMQRGETPLHSTPFPDTLASTKFSSTSFFYNYLHSGTSFHT